MIKTYKKEEFKTLFRLASKQPWLSDKEDELIQLCFEDCQNQAQQEIVIRLIDNFEFVSRDKYASLIAELVKLITSNETLSIATTQIVATAADDDADSSQHLLYDLKIGFASSGWQNPTLVNSFSAAYKNHKRNPNLTNIVLVDEFIGSGHTVEGRVKEIRRQFQINNIDNIEIYAFFIVGCEIGLKRVAPLLKDVSALITLKRGISDCFPPEEAQIAINEMKDLESILSQNWEQDLLPSLGFGEAEALYYRNDGNPPNNNFPIFWWPLYKDGNLRKTLLRRISSKR